MDNLANLVANPQWTTINRIILDPKNAGLLALIKAARNGAVYGAKVRFPHALVMVFLFRSGTLREKLILILKATRQHARNLALFAFLYKSLHYTSTHLPLLPTSTASTTISKPSPHTPFLAGLLAGYAVFGRGIQSSVNQQIVIYVFGRVVLGFAKLAVQDRRLMSAEVAERVRGNAWPVFASASWGGVMWLFYNYPEVLQPSLRSSMKYIYANADHWDSFRNFLIHNT